MKYILQCPRCRNIIDWERKSDNDGPGSCHCGAWAPWNVLKERPKPQPGYVIVMSDKGWQQLHGPLWREDKNGWKPYQ